MWRRTKPNWTMRAFGWIIALVAVPGAASLRPLACPRQADLFAIQSHFHTSLEHFLEVYSVLVERRPKVVADHIKAYQIHAIGQDFLEIFNALHRLACLALCPDLCMKSSDKSLEDSIIEVRFLEKINNLQLDVELVSSDISESLLEGSQQLLRSVKRYAVSLINTILPPQEEAHLVDWLEAIGTCISNVISRVVYPLIKFVTTSSPSNESDTILSAVSFDASNPASGSASYVHPSSLFRKHEPRVEEAEDEVEEDAEGEIAFGMLRSLATGGESLHLYSVPDGFNPKMCSPSASPYLLQGSGGAPSWPRRWMSELAGLQAGSVASLVKHMEDNMLELSHTYMVLRPSGAPGAMTREIDCSGTGLDYDPSLCLASLGWGGHIYNVNIHPPYKAELYVVSRRTGDQDLARHGTQVDLLHMAAWETETESLESVMQRIDWMWRQARSPSPDVYYMHPGVQNCHAVEYLFSGAPLRPKVLVIPINPLIPPPFEVLPRFEAWWQGLEDVLKDLPRARRWVDEAFFDEHPNASEDDDGYATMDDWEAMMDQSLNASFWLSQCSLAAVEAMMRRQVKKRFGYVLHSLDRGVYAVYVRADLHKSLSKASQALGPSGAATGQSTRIYAAWLRGWFCSPRSRLFDQLELMAGHDALQLADTSLSQAERERRLCRFLEDHAIPVVSKNFACEAQSMGNHLSCSTKHLRGWGNEEVVDDSIQDSAHSCALLCARKRDCTYWTFDPTAHYGATLCWVWIGGRPEELRSERDWISGDMTCETNKTQPERAARSVAGSKEAKIVAESGGMALARQWAALPLREQPGMRYFIEAGKRGRCTHGLCECFPPYRGPLCETVEPGKWDTSRNYTAALHYLTSNDVIDIQDISHSLPLLWKHYNQKVDYPVVIFHDGLSDEHRERIVNASSNRIWFAFVDDFLDIPDMFMKDPVKHAMLDEVKWSLGYRGMCRFRSGTIFLQPVLKQFDYAMTLDTDGYFPASIEADPIEIMHNGGYIYTWSHLLPDLPGAVEHFWDYTLMFMRMKNINPRGTRILRQFVTEEDLQWTYQLYMNDIEIVQLDWFRSDPYQDYFRYLDSVGGFWLHRWGDHAMRTIAVGMWLPHERVYEMNIPYAHQNYCSCSDAHPDLQCEREVNGEVKAKWTCTRIGEDF